jgi:hypothetical protein
VGWECIIYQMHSDHIWITSFTRSPSRRQLAANGTSRSRMPMENPAWTKAFAIAHDLEIGYFLTLKKLYPRLGKVAIFDFSGAHMVKRCPPHPKAFKRIVDKELLSVLACKRWTWSLPSGYHNMIQHEFCSSPAHLDTTRLCREVVVGYQTCR